ncbi:MAG: hypothetical protein GY817_04660 [bacterium]|nr:hypothetical protein [bacterium]
MFKLGSLNDVKETWTIDEILQAYEVIKAKNEVIKDMLDFSSGVGDKTNGNRQRINHKMGF